MLPENFVKVEKIERNRDISNDSDSLLEESEFDDKSKIIIK
jgi:hypothetical protein